MNETTQDFFDQSTVGIQHDKENSAEGPTVTELVSTRNSKTAQIPPYQGSGNDGSGKKSAEQPGRGQKRSSGGGSGAGGSGGGGGGGKDGDKDKKVRSSLELLREIHRFLTFGFSLRS